MTCRVTELTLFFFRQLLEYEPRASLQVPLLLRLDQRRAALEKALRCGDTDLIFYVILTLKESMPLGELHLLIRFLINLEIL